jgi:HEPN domain-containing protein
MQPDRFRLARYWLAAAEQDVQAAIELRERMPNVACFHAQQGSEKALKALLVAVAGDVMRSHLSDTLLMEARDMAVHIPEDIINDAQALDKFYIASRYPDALGSDITTAFKSDEAAAAITRVERVLAYVRATIDAIPQP